MISPMIPLIIQSIEDDNDREFMENLFLEYHRLMYSKILEILKDNWATEDVLQTALENLIDKIQLLRTLDRPQLANYVVTTSRNTSLNYLREKKKLPEFSFDDDFDSANYQEPGFEQKLLRQESIESVNSAWDKLDDRSRQILELKYIQEKTNSEIAQELDLKPSSIHKTLGRARNNLKAQLAKVDVT